MPHEPSANAPDATVLRECMDAHQVLVTTVLDHRRVSKDALSPLYARRWNVALDRCHLKTTTGMDVLRCQTPQMNGKQWWVHLLAHHVIRLLMAQATSNADMEPRNLSVKHAVQRWTQCMACGLTAAHGSGQLFVLIAPCQVGHRPGRIEPRMRKRRPKPYPWLKTPRAHARRQVQRHGHAWATKSVPFGLGGLSKLVAPARLEPALATPPLRLVCHDVEFEQLLANLALHHMDTWCARSAAGAPVVWA